MSHRILPLLLVFVIATAVAMQAESTDFLPAGTLLSCTMDEPNFSAKTAEVGDPVLCYLGMTAFSGRTLFPRGASLGGHLADANKPGHFFGKGSLSLEFDRLIMPGEGIFPLSAKVVAVPHYKIARNGKINGKGHPKRDAVEWMIPILWPVKVLTLPARGPYPALKGETRLTLRLMEDVALPTQRATNRVPMPPWAHPTSFTPVSSMGSDFHLMNATVQEVELPQHRPQDETLIVLKNRSAYLVESYRLDHEVLRCVFHDGTERAFGLSELDFPSTIDINHQRGIGIVLEMTSTPQIQSQ
jgi:hypothetical protein